MQTPQRIALRNLRLENVQQSAIKLPASPFLKSLGCGTGVNVYRLDRSPKSGLTRSPWAIKRVSRRMAQNDSDSAEIFNSRIQEEAEILRKLSHPNIVGFRGISKSKDGVDTLVLECCGTSLGLLLEERHEEELGPLPSHQTLKMIVDIAGALDYLHTEAQLLHGDIKSYNVLVRGDFEICKLCDFGVVLPMDAAGLIDFRDEPNMRYVGTNLWSAPEIMEEEDVIDCKADIFSFGLVIYETIALVPPHTLNMTANYDDDNENIQDSNSSSALNPTANATNDASLNTTDASCTTDDEESLDNLIEHIDSACGTRPPLPQAFELNDDYKIIVELYYCCTNAQPEDRPTAKVICQSLQQQQQPQQLAVEKLEKQHEKDQQIVDEAINTKEQK